MSILLSNALAARADEIVLRNGDRLTGSVVRMEVGKLIFNADLVGEISVKSSDVSSATTTGPVRLLLPGGQLVEDRLGLHPLDQIDKINPEPVAWHGDLKAGLVVNKGNTDTHEGHGNFDIRRKSDVDKWSFGLGYAGARQTTSNANSPDTTETTKRRYTGYGRYDRDLSERTYWYLASNGESDGEADLDLRVVTGPGLGYRLIDRPGQTLSVESGLSWVRDRYGDNSRDTDYLAARLGWDFDQLLNDRVKFFHDGSYIPSLREITDTGLVDTYTGFRFDITRDWFAEAAMRWKLNMEPASGTERRDVEYLFGLGWGF